MKQSSLPHELRRRLREYFHHTKHLRATKRDTMLLRSMSDTLQVEVAWTTNHRWLLKVALAHPLPISRGATCHAFPSISPFPACVLLTHLPLVPPRRWASSTTHP